MSEDKLRLCYIPAPVLREETLEVAYDKSIKKIISEMLKIMQDNEGIGLAAPQVGLRKKIFIVDKKDGEDIFVFINPVITYFSSSTNNDKEGCLSIPGVKASITRSNEIKIQYLDLKGKQISRSFSDLTARVIQHEMDHLNGILFLDKLTQVKSKYLFKKSLNFIQKNIVL